jgi:Flp pilus assembly protein TadG
MIANWTSKLLHASRIKRSGLRKTSTGAAAVEMALITMLLVTTSLGVAELGRAIHYYDTLAKQARAAARYLAQRDSTDPTLQAQARTQAANVAVCGLANCAGARPVLPSLTVANVSVRSPENTAALGNISVSSSVSPFYGTTDMVVVTIGPPATAYQFTSLASFVIPNLSFPAISVAMPRPL